MIGTYFTYLKAQNDTSQYNMRTFTITFIIVTLITHHSFDLLLQSWALPVPQNLLAIDHLLRFLWK